MAFFTSKKTVIALMLLAFLLPVLGNGATPEELRKQITEREDTIKNLEAEIADYQKSLDRTQEEKDTLRREIQKVQTQIKKLNADIRLSEQNISKTELVIEDLDTTISQKETDILEKKRALAELLRTMYETDNESLVEIMLAHDHISDFFGETEYLSDFDTALQSSLSNLYELKKELEGNREAMTSEKKRLENYKQDVQAQKYIQQDVEKGKNTLLDKTKQDEARYQIVLSEREKQRAAILSEIASIEDELRKLVDPSTLPGKKSGVLAWPVSAPSITQGFGLTDFAKSRTDVYNGGGHNGIDLKANIGTPILSSGEGVVMDTGNTDLSCPGGSYGKWVVIEHPNKLATLYAHLSLVNVTKGQAVKSGERVGYSGDTGFTTGPHLHFTVYDARTVKFGPSKSGRCTYLPFGGYLNPLDYL